MSKFTEHELDAVIVSAARTAVGKANKGSFAETRAEDLGRAAIRGALERVPELSPEAIEDVIIGCAMPEGEQGLNMARVISLYAGLPVTTPAVTINRFCASGLQSIAYAAERIRLGMETRVLKLAASEKVAPHAAHESFPGKAPADAPRVSSEVSVNPAIPGWTSTGLYAAAGESIQVTLPPALAGKGYAVRIGCHSDSLYHLESWSRAPA